VLETEGASGQEEDPDRGYAVVSVEAQAYDGRTVRALTLTVLPKVKARLQASGREGRCCGGGEQDGVCG
jgi:hypothetical protein